MNQHIQNILITADIILIFYFAFKSQTNMKEEYKDKWLQVMNGLGSKEWFTEEGWSYLRKSGFSILFGASFLFLMLVLFWILG
jgi:hypothetical protein